MRRQFEICAIAAISFLSSSASFAGGVSVSDGWFRALPSGLPAGGYFTLHNGGATPVDLVAAKSTACGMLMLHQSVTEGGMSRMREVNGVTAPAGGTISFAPGGYHLMCTKPTSAMTPGGRVKVIFVFSDNNRIDADFAVKGASGK